MEYVADFIILLLRGACIQHVCVTLEQGEAAAREEPETRRTPAFPVMPRRSRTEIGLAVTLH